MSDFANYFLEGSIDNGPDYLTGWDLGIIDGVKLPGITLINGASLKLKKDPNQKPGANGGKPVYHGLEEQDLQLQVIIWKNSQIDILFAIQDKIVPVPGVAPKNVSIVSEWCRLSRITNINVHGFTDFKPHNSRRCENGLEIGILCTHWLGASKGAGKVQTVQPKRALSSTRPFQGAPDPTKTAGALAPPANASFQP